MAYAWSVLDQSKNIDSSLEPLDEYIVIQPVSDETETRAGLILPASALSWSEERRSAVVMHELAHVRRLDALAHRNQGGVVVITGEAGIGKSRMVADLVERTQVSTVRSVRQAYRGLAGEP